jgi:signal transduction histidine kinase
VFILIALVVSVAIALGLTFMTVRRLSSRIGGLKEAASRIAKQNYSTPIDARGSDEIAALAQKFEEMRNKVQETNDHLNELVAKRTRELEAANTELKRFDQLKDEFISIVSHEMRNPIMPILGYIDLAVKGYMPAPQALQRIKISAEKLRRLTTDILDSSKIGSNNLILKLDKASVNELMRGVVESALVNPNLKQGVFVETALGSDVMMPIDKSRMTQMLTNLVNNAMKFTRKGSITLSARSCRRKGGNRGQRHRRRHTRSFAPEPLQQVRDKEQQGRRARLWPWPLHQQGYSRSARRQHIRKE